MTFLSIRSFHPEPRDCGDRVPDQHSLPTFEMAESLGDDLVFVQQPPDGVKLSVFVTFAEQQAHLLSERPEPFFDTVGVSGADSFSLPYFSTISFSFFPTLSDRKVS